MIQNKFMYFDKRPPNIEKCLAEIALPDIELTFYEPCSGKKGKLEEVEVILAHARGVPIEVMEQMPNLKIISLGGIGFDSQQLEYTKNRGIYICNCSGGASEHVAEFDVGLMLALYRRIVHLSNRVREGKWLNWEYRDNTPCLDGKTLGVIGAGGIGRALLKKCKAFHMRGLYYDVFRMTEEQEAALGVAYADMETLLCESDVVVLLVPLNKNTYHMMGKEQFALMKKNAIFINDSRGNCVDQDALIEALKNEQIWGAALDVVTPEPLPADSPLLSIPEDRLIVTPHQGSSTREGMTEMFRFACENGLRVVNGETPLNIVNGL